jgi:3-dehydrotetronate 4-kinase
MPILLGAVADDFTGATDLCNTLVKGGMRTVQAIGVPPEGLDLPEADAVVVALKSRTCPPDEAVAASLQALAWLREAGARQTLFKYCSTFDSTERGNIGPVADALMEALGAGIAVVCPAFPETGRTIYRGHLFVGDALLSDTHMRDHPLTPMRDSSLVRLMGRQTRHKVGLVRWDAVARGAEAVREALAGLRAEGCRYAVADALEDGHLRTLGHACADAALVTGGSGIALGLPDNFKARSLLAADAVPDAVPSVPGPGAVLSGSCSAATRAQVAAFAARRPAFRLDPLREPGPQTEEALAWATARLGGGPVLVYATAAPEEVRAAQERLGTEAAAQRVEAMMAAVARGLTERGVRRLVIAGGETSGAVVQALGVRALRIGPQIDPGVPCTVTVGDGPPLALALKSGNFGGEGFFLKALETMP